MKKIEIFDDSIGKDIIPVNIPKDYNPQVGQYIECIDGMYRVNKKIESDFRITLVVEKINDNL